MNFLINLVSFMSLFISRVGAIEQKIDDISVFLSIKVLRKRKINYNSLQKKALATERELIFIIRNHS